MDYLFVDTEFEPGMGFVVETLTHCIENRVHGWITKKNKDFSVAFAFLGLKSKSNEVKRKAENEPDVVLKKIRKLNVSIENLSLIDSQDDSICGAIKLESASEKRRTRFTLKNGTQSKRNTNNDRDVHEVDSIGDSHGNRKRKVHEDDQMEVIYQNTEKIQAKKIKK